MIRRFANRSVRSMFVAIVATVVIAFPLGVFASHQFSDVPNGHTFHGDIDVLVDAGLTTGCGGGKYCPEEFVTRGQIAAFLNRLGALSPTKTPVVNADRIDGLNSSAFDRPLFAVVNSTGSLARGSGIVSSVKLAGTGTYEVIFDRDITACAFNAVAGVAGGGSTFPAFGVVAVRNGTTNGVFLAWVNAAGTAVDSGFHLTLTCPYGATGASGESQPAPGPIEQPK